MTKKNPKPDFSKLFTKALIVEKDVEAGTFTAVASNARVDRHGEIVSPEGWNLDNYKKNPVLLWSHDHTIPAIGKATKVWVEGVGSQAKLMFSGAWQTVTKEGKAAAELVKLGILNSFSVGFIPSEMEGNTYTEQELLEISLVNVPANPDAMMLAYKTLKAGGLNEDVARYVTQQFAGLTTVRKDLFSQERGALQDELDLEAMWEAKCEKMADVWDIMWALCDVYYDEGTPVDEFGTLITEMINLLNQVADGTFVAPDDVVVVEDDADPQKVLDSPDKKPKTVDNEAKAPQPAAPKAPSQSLRAKQSITKAIAKSADQLLEGEKRGNTKEDRVHLAKIIKRGAEVLSQAHKGEMK